MQQKNMFHTLGQLTHEQKQNIWTNKMSGSQVKRVFNDAYNLWMEKTGQAEAIDLSKTGAKEALEMGNIMEDVILNRAIEVHGWDIKVDKDTFESNVNPWFTANIDGYIGADINNVETIIEIKNTTCDDPNELLNRYYLQVAYYMWFFNAKDAKLVYLVNGQKLKFIPIIRDMEFEKEMIATLESFRDSIVLGMSPAIPESEEEAEKILTLEEENVEFEVKTNFERLAEVRAQLKELKETEEAILEGLKNKFSDYKKVTFQSGVMVYEKTTTQRAGNVDYPALLLYLAGQYNFDFKGMQESFRKGSSETTTFRIKEIK